MRVVRSGDKRVWVESDAGDAFGFEFTTRSALMIEMIGEASWASGAAPPDRAAVLDRARAIATAFGRDAGWLD